MSSLLTENESPPVVLTNWQAFEAQLPCYESPTWHIAGDVRTRGTGTVTAALLAVVDGAGAAVSKTGRRYVLEGPPGSDAESLFAFELWRDLYESTVLREITFDVLKGHQPKPVKMNKSLIGANW